jgi:hypothetical protein
MEFHAANYHGQDKIKKGSETLFSFYSVLVVLLQSQSLWKHSKSHQFGVGPACLCVGFCTKVYLKIILLEKNSSRKQVPELQDKIKKGFETLFTFYSVLVVLLQSQSLWKHSKSHQFSVGPARLCVGFCTKVYLKRILLEKNSSRKQIPELLLVAATFTFTRSTVPLGND